DPAAGVHRAVHPEAAARAVRAEGTRRRVMSALASTLGLGRRGRIFLVVVLGAAIVVPLLNLLPPESSALHVPTYVMSLLGKYLCYALLAVAVDLVWGYCGILSLGHGAFFALGGYAMGM